MSSLYAQMESLVAKSQGCEVVLEEKKREFDSLQEGLRSQWCSSSEQLCFSKEELDHLVMQTVFSKLIPCMHLVMQSGS